MTLKVTRGFERAASFLCWLRRDGALPLNLRVDVAPD